MKTTFIALALAAAGLVTPVAMSFASTAPKTSAVAKPVAVTPVAAQAVAAPAVAQAAPVCGPKVRVVYSGYVQPAPAGC